MPFGHEDKQFDIYVQLLYNPMGLPDSDDANQGQARILSVRHLESQDGRAKEGSLEGFRGIGRLADFRIHFTDSLFFGHTHTHTHTDTDNVVH